MGACPPVLVRCLSVPVQVRTNTRNAYWYDAVLDADPNTGTPFAYWYRGRAYQYAPVLIQPTPVLDRTSYQCQYGGAYQYGGERSGTAPYQYAHNLSQYGWAYQYGGYDTSTGGHAPKGVLSGVWTVWGLGSLRLSLL